MINFKKCTIFFMCILSILGVVGMTRQCYSLRKHAGKKVEIINTETKKEMTDENKEIIRTDCDVEYEGTIYSLGDTRDEILRKMENIDPLDISETQEYIILQECLCLYFDQRGVCVAISFMSFPWAETIKGIHIGSQLEDMIECYGDSYEKFAYPEENYEVYSYNHNDYIIKFGVMKQIEYYDDEMSKLPIIQNIEIYNPDKYNPYSYETSVKGVVDCSVAYKGMELSLENEKSDIMQNSVKHGIEVKETEEYTILDDAVCLYFDEKDVCVRISVLNDLPKTIQGISKLDYLDDMIECYGDTYERFVFAHKGIYKVYRYYNNDYVMEFGFPGTYAGNPTQLLNLEIYHKSVSPIYDYGEPFDYENLI